MQTRPVQISIEWIIAQNGQLLLTGDFTNYSERMFGTVVGENGNFPPTRRVR
jgi:hypothetical protein